ncbi:mucin-binding protein [Ligilactobacillus aviarius]|uniref:mucin-binding protein n=3 Tax=Ligilactobacillus aviarius TaxID=1606 RepID=UPI000A665081|nr:MucBP domain-containing protein [Ligilactobacillus aviarius]
MSNTNINKKLLVSTFVLGGVLTANSFFNTNVNADNVNIKSNSISNSTVKSSSSSSSSSSVYSLRSSQTSSKEGSSLAVQSRALNNQSEENSNSTQIKSSSEEKIGSSQNTKIKFSQSSQAAVNSSTNLHQNDLNLKVNDSSKTSSTSSLEKTNLNVQSSSSSVDASSKVQESTVNKDEYKYHDFIYFNDVNNVTSDGTFAPVYPWKETGHRWEKDMDYVMVGYKDQWGKNDDVMSGLPGTTYGYGNQTSVDKFETSPYVTINAPTGYKFDVAYTENFDIDKSHFFNFISDTEVRFNWQQYAAERGRTGTFELFLYNAKTGHPLPVNKQDGIQIHWISNKDSHPIANYPFIPIKDLPDLTQTKQSSKVYYKVYVPKGYKIDNKTTSQYTADHDKATDGNYSLFYIPGYTGAGDTNTYTWAYIKPDWMPKSYLEKGTLNIVGWVDPDSSNQGNSPEWIPMTDKAAELSGVQSNGNITINYVDKTTGKVIKSDKISGKVGSESNYSTANEIKELEAKGYELVSNGYGNGKKFEKNDQTFNVELKHKIENYSNSNNPLNLSLSKQITNTINYRYENGEEAAPSVKQTITFIRTAKKDMVTGKITYENWTSTETTFSSVKSPQINGYVPSQENSNLIKVTENSSNIVQTITYSKIKSESTNENKPADKPVNNNTSENKPADKPANNNTSENKPADKPANNNTSENKPADKPANNNTSENKPADKPVNNNTSENKPADKPANNNTSENKPADKSVNNNEISTSGYAEQNISTKNALSEKLQNSKKSTLPQTGENSNKHTLLGTIALAFSGILAMLRLSKKEKNNR